MKQKHAHKVAYHDGFGPFALPLIVAERFCELAGIQVDIYEMSKVSNIYYIEDDVLRHDENLIRAIEEFPRECANAQVFLHPLEGDKYIITEYDGLEEVKEPDDIDWVKVNKRSHQMTKKNPTPTIILELTPREAAVIHSMAWSARWDKGDYGSECREIAKALEDVGHEFPNFGAYMSDEKGILRSGSFWFIDEANEDENLHPYSGA